MVSEVFKVIQRDMKDPVISSTYTRAKLSKNTAFAYSTGWPKCKIQSDTHMAVRGTMHFIFYLFPFFYFFAILTKLFLKASFIAFNAMCTLQSYKSDDLISAKSISIKVSNEFVRGFLQFASPILSQLKK